VEDCAEDSAASDVVDTAELVVIGLDVGTTEEDSGDGLTSAEELSAEEVGVSVEDGMKDDRASEVETADERPSEVDDMTEEVASAEGTTVSEEAASEAIDDLHRVSSYSAQQFTSTHGDENTDDGVISEDGEVVVNSDSRDDGPALLDKGDVLVLSRSFRSRRT
jgi:hypothetical protein